MARKKHSTVAIDKHQPVREWLNTIAAVAIPLVMILEIVSSVVGAGPM